MTREAYDREQQILRKAWLDYGREKEIQKGEIQSLREEVNYLLSQSPACQYHQAARDLIESCRDGKCDVNSMVSSLKTLVGKPESWVAAYLHPTTEVSSFVGPRKEQVRNLLLGRRAHSTTQWLVVVRPQSSSAEHLEQADRIAKALQSFIQEQFPSTKAFHSYTSRPINCTQDVQTAFNLFRQQRDRGPLLNIEPQGKSIIAIFFRLDCAEKTP